MVKPKKGRQPERQRFSRRDPNYDPNDDIALLSIPFEASIKGVADVMKAFENGTSEVKYLLQYECGLLFECRVCKGIFRSIVNFITHKRVYCRGRGPTDGSQTGDSFNEFMKDIQSLVVVQEPVTNEEPSSLTTTVTNGDSIVTEEKPILSFSRLSKRKGFPRKNLIEVLDRLSQKEVTELDRSVTSRDRACLLNDPPSKHPLAILSLQKIEHTDVAMRQTVTLGPDGKIVNDQQGIKDTYTDDIQDGDTVLDLECESNQSKVVNVEKLCKPCNVVFSTRKTFRQHLKSKHNSNRSWYLCPDCTNVFSQVYSVQRHLRRFHHKTEAQMRKLHGKIKYLPENQLPVAYFTSVIQKKPLSKIARQENKRLAEVRRRTNSKSELAEKCKTRENTCTDCFRKFDRIAAFNSHMQTCPKRSIPQGSTKQQSSSSEVPLSMSRSSVRNFGGEILLTKINIAEHSEIETGLDTGNSRHFSTRIEIEDDLSSTSDNANIEVLSTSSESQNVPSTVGMNHRVRHESEMRLEPPVKRIEIQLRMDYNKVTIGSSQPIAAKEDVTNEITTDNMVEPSLSLTCLTNNDNVALVRPASSSNIIQDNLQKLPESGTVICRPIKGSLVTIKNKAPRKLKGLVPGDNVNSISGNSVLFKKVIENRKLKTYANSVLASRLTSNNFDGIVNSKEIHGAPISGNRLGFVNLKDIVAQSVNKSDVIDGFTPFLSNSMDSSEYGRLIIDKLSDAQSRQSADKDGLMSRPDCHLKVESPSENMTNKINECSEFLQGENKNRPAVKKEILCYKCIKCLCHFSSLSECNNHLKKVHGIFVDIHHQSLVSKLPSLIDVARASTSQQKCIEMNGDLFEDPTFNSLDMETDQLSLLSNSNDSNKFVEGTCFPDKCSLYESTSDDSSTPSFQSNSDFLKPFLGFKGCKVGQGRNKLNPHEKPASNINQRPKRQPHPRKSWIVPAATKPKSTHRKVSGVTKQINIKPTRKIQRNATIFKRGAAEKNKVAPNSKRVKLGTSTPLQKDAGPPKSDDAENQESTRPVKSPTQDNTNVYKNVDKSLIEIIFGSDMGNIFSSESYSNEEEVTIIEDQISGTFSLDISSTSTEKVKETTDEIKTDTQEFPPIKMRRRLSFSENSNKQRSSSADSVQRLSRRLNAIVSHSMENLSPTKPSLPKVKVKRSCSSEFIDHDIIVNHKSQDKLTNFKDLKETSLMVLDNVTISNSLKSPLLMLACPESNDCVGIPSCKQNIVSALESFSSEKSKPSDGETSSTSYNISTRKSVRVVDTKP